MASSTKVDQMVESQDGAAFLASLDIEEGNCPAKEEGALVKKIIIIDHRRNDTISVEPSIHQRRL